MPIRFDSNGGWYVVCTNARRAFVFTSQTTIAKFLHRTLHNPNCNVLRNVCLQQRAKQACYTIRHKSVACMAKQSYIKPPAFPSREYGTSTTETSTLIMATTRPSTSIYAMSFFSVSTFSSHISTSISTTPSRTEINNNVSTPVGGHNFSLLSRPSGIGSDSSTSPEPMTVISPLYLST